MALPTKKEGDRAVAREKTRKAKDREVSRKAGIAIGAVVGSGAFALITRKFPRTESIDAAGKLPTQPIVGVAALLSGMGGRNVGLFGMGVGLLSCSVSDWVQQQPWAQPM